VILAAKWAKRDKLHAEGRKLYAEGRKLYAEGRKLHAEGDKLRAEGDKLYAEAVIDVFGGKALINWDNGDVTSESRVAIPLCEVK
jgi:hypothetical protein